MKYIFLLILCFSFSCNKIKNLSQTSGTTVEDKLLDVKLSEVNSTKFTVPLDVNLPEQQISLKTTKSECSAVDGQFFSLELNGEPAKNICLTKDSLKSTGVF